jgi:acylphosphatase
MATYGKEQKMEKRRARVLISGRVQGVNFRASTRDQARKIGVAGWVKNLEDGRVEAVFEGNHGSVQRMVSWCYSGPVGAEVEHVKVEWEEPQGKESTFVIDY